MNTFNEVEHTPLRVFNRLVFLFNLLEDKGKEYASIYLKKFSQSELNEIYLMRGIVEAKGVDEVRKIVTKDVVFDYDPAEDIEYGI